MQDSTATYSVSCDSVITESPATVEAAALPADSAFVHSTLKLPHTAHSSYRQDTGENDIATDILTSIFIVLFLLFFKKFINILPDLFGCMLKWKEAVHLEDNMQLKRNRNSIALLLIIPFCMIAAKYGFIPRLASSGYSPAGNIAATFIVLSGYIVIRVICNLLGKTIPGKKKTFDTATYTSMTFFCIYTVTAMAVAGIMSVAKVPSDITRAALLYVLALVYIVFLIRKSQIFRNSCSLFYTFLYLCTLEILPTAILIALVVFL